MADREVRPPLFFRDPDNKFLTPVLQYWIDMDKVEARTLLKEFLEELQKKPYDELVSLIRNPVSVGVKGPSGLPYQIEYESLWDSEPNGLLRIMASIDNGGLISAMFPITLCFLVDSDGTVQA